MAYIKKAKKRKVRLLPVFITILLLVVTAYIIWSCVAEEDGGSKNDLDTSSDSAVINNVDSEEDTSQSKEETQPISSEEVNGSSETTSQEPENYMIETDNYTENEGYGLLTVINKKYRLAEKCKVPKLVRLSDTVTGRSDAKYDYDNRAVNAISDFLAAAREQGYKPIIYSAYRTYTYQKNLYENAVKDNMKNGMTREEAEKAVVRTAPPGCSEHCIGLAADIYTWEAQSKYGKLDERFESDPLAVWMKENAHKYGFILRYPKDKEDITQIAYEPWHFRYVGVEDATKIYEAGQCLEEYTGKL